MTNRQKNGIACCVIATLMAGIAIKNSFFTPEIAVGDPSGVGVSRMVGAFLPAILALAVGVWLLQPNKD